MKKQIPTRLLSAFLAVVMVFLMVPVVVSAEDASTTTTPSIDAPYQGVGRGFDARNGNASAPEFTPGAILSIDDSYIEISPYKDTKSKYLSSETLSEMTSKYAESLEVSVGLDLPISKLNLGVNAKFSKNSSVESSLIKSQLYQLYLVTEFRNQVSLKNIYGLESQKANLSDDFKAIIDQIEEALTANDEKRAGKLIDQLFTYYGTHLVTAYNLGGRLELTNHITSTESRTVEVLEQKGSLGIDIGAGKLFSISSDITRGTNTTNEDQYKDINTAVWSEVLGGIYPDILTYNSTYYKAWQESMVAYEKEISGQLLGGKNLMAVGFVDDNSLVAVWDLVDNESVRNAMMNQYYCQVSGFYHETTIVSDGSTINHFDYVSVDASDEKVYDVSANAKVYLDAFLPADGISQYSIKSGNEYASIHEEQGILQILNVAAGDTESQKPLITVSIKSNGTEVAEITFAVGATKFSGGFGTEEQPYLIATKENIINLSRGETLPENTHLLLVRDIDMDGTEFSGIEKFYGVFDGNGHKIYNFKIAKAGEPIESVFHVGFFNINYGTIKNLTLGSPEISYDQYTREDEDKTYSAMISSLGTYESYGGKIACVGGLVGTNAQNAKIINCNTVNIYVLGNLNDNIDDMFPLIGGRDDEIEAKNRTITYCGALVGRVCENSSVDYGVVKDCRVFSYMEAVVDGGDDNQIFAGGIIGINQGNVSYLISRGVKLAAYTYADGHPDNWAFPLARGGGICGANNAVMENCIAYDTFFDVQIKGNYFTGGRPDAGDAYWGGCVGFQETSAVNCYTNITDESEATVVGSGIETGCYRATVEVIASLFANESALHALETGHMITNDISSLLVYHYDQQVFKESGRFTPVGIKITGVTHKGTQQLTPFKHFEIAYPSSLLAGENEIILFTYGLSDTLKINAACLVHQDTTEWQASENSAQHSRICNTCQMIEYADHAWNSVETKEATHLEAGELTKTCSNCGAIKIETIEPIADHSFGNWTKHDDTQHTRSCECGETEYEDHDWDDGTITIPATYEQDGVKTYACLDCEATYTVVIPKPLDVYLFVVDDAGAVPGGTMQVKVQLKNNPGVAMMRLRISYDSSMLTLEQVTYNTEIGGTAQQPAFSDGYVTLLWYNDRANVEGDWVFATLSFTVKETATPGSTSDIILTYNAEEVCDIEENNVVFSINNGIASVLDHVPGDINGDNALTSKDLLRLARYFADWDVEVNELAMDVNGDGSVSSKDLLRLARYLAGWDVEIF